MKKTRAFLKWAGGKYSLVEEIAERLPAGRVLLEPFVGAGSVFLNTDYDAYVLNDINPDLISLYNHLKLTPDNFIDEARKLFVTEHNHKAAYYRLRTQFNHTEDTFERALLFLFLNRHGFNGLCRYNKKGGFNVPFGSYKKPYFPEKELWAFAEKAQKATFICESYADAIKRAEEDWVIYCDPPYVPLSTTASFTSYAACGFTLDDQVVLSQLARQTAAEKGVPVLISNHDMKLTRDLYRGARFDEILVKRTISRNGGTRNKVAELLALYPPGIEPEQGYYPSDSELLPLS
ncbi:Dam family site-specific DNA-(adenine-N6)-methyltransferase [Aeromonas enteropelogenes]|uniref:Dam family site-specific DNA-(adenine-N6)-methyltransferase n=1 Tax=Aeromonas enteropelogenes TaxID=29489 RepID=UPI0005AB8A1E|nr:Dam family site-specific DNA-(adenine-N6)-methyltransferase [Aeromonas enteropelogenes]UBH50726.1 Dam family site-specific DNA-(adenine-N6)-methyltransferase [Aeromonas enteropelogenes]